MPAIAGILALSTLVSCREPTTSPILLEPGVQVGSNSLDYSIELEAGDFAHVSIQHLGVDGQVLFYDPFNHLLQALDTSSGMNGPEDLYLVAETAGRHRIEFTPTTTSEEGSFSARLVELRRATDVDRKTITAAHHLTEARIRARRNDLEGARVESELALRTYRNQNDKGGIALANLQMGKLAWRAEDLAIAASRYQESRDLWRQLGDTRSEALVETLLALVYSRQGNVDESLSAYDQAVALSREIDDGFLEANALFKRALLYQELKDIDRAGSDLSRSLAITSRLMPNSRDVAHRLLVLSQIQVARGEKATAEKTAKRALEIVRKEGDQAFESKMMLELGDIYRALGRFDESRQAYEIALSQRQVLRDIFGEATVQLRLADLVNESENDPERALSHSQRALEIARTLADKPGETQALRSVARAHGLAGNLDQARSVLEEATLLSESQRPPSARPVQRATWLERRRLVYEDLIGVLMALHRQQPDKAFDIKAYNASEQQRSIGSIDLLSQTAEAQAAVNSVAVQPMTVHATQDELLDDKALLLHYLLGEEHSYLWALTKESFSSYLLPPRELIDDAARETYTLLVDSRSRKDSVRVRLALRNLGSMVLGPVAGEMKSANRLLIIPDGALHYIPFAALELPNGDLGWPLQRETVRMPSASALAFIRKRSEGRPATEPKVAILADPVFQADDPRLPDVATRPQLRPEEVRLTRMASADFAGFQRLAGARLEAESIAALVKPERRLEAYGFAANRETVLAGRLNDFTILHFATHGWIDPTDPGRSKIVFSTYGEDGRPQVGTLAAYEIAGLKLNAELVVLSACQTGLGKEIRGEGLVGLSQAFFSAGARRVVASLWTVDDRATSLLMQHFYRKLLVDDLPPASALHHAQLWLQSQERWREPYYWAGFVLQGDWR